MQHLISLKDWSTDEITAILDLADAVKTAPENYRDAMQRRMLVMIFEKPSLRTRVSFETGICQMGGNAIFYDMATSPLAAGKETIADMVKVLSRYADLLMARLFEHRHMKELAANAEIPVINGLTNFNHPCQVLADLQTIREKKGPLAGLTLAYLGDANNNVTHSLLYGCSKVGVTVRIGCPTDPSASPLPAVVADATAAGRAAGAEVVVTHDPAEAVAGADVVYTDSWMSYHIPKSQMAQRVRQFMPYQVSAKLMALAAADAIFMNCLPAMRGYEQAAEVIDGPQAVVFDQAENRLHAQKAVMLRLLGKA
ncbi:MAG: ornithine carbamoyltransferase [Desulfobacterales bacterium]|nr:ornithine carbamoyltransferase [Desulfobacterales bacterium]